MGLTMLNAATLSDSKRFYEDKVLFNYEKLNDQIHLLHKIQYSPQLTEIIERMCEAQPNKRVRSS